MNLNFIPIFLFIASVIFLKTTTLHAVNWRIWFFAYLIGTFLDVASTYMGVSILGISAESNPTARFLFEKIGLWNGLLIHSAFFIFVFLLAGLLLGENSRWGVLAKCAIFTVALGRVVASFNNMAVLELI